MCKRAYKLNRSYTLHTRAGINPGKCNLAPYIRAWINPDKCNLAPNTEHEQSQTNVTSTNQKRTSDQIYIHRFQTDTDKV